MLLSRVVRSFRSGALRAALAVYLAVMFCYGVGNIANDFWLEQVVKRGWTTWQIPNVLEPRVNVAWAVIVFAAAAISAVAMLRERDDGIPAGVGPAVNSSDVVDGTKRYDRSRSGPREEQ